MKLSAERPGRSLLPILRFIAVGHPNKLGLKPRAPALYDSL